MARCENHKCAHTGGHRVKSLSIGFLADFEEAWQKHGKKVLEILVEKYPQAFFGGAVA